MKTAKAFVDSYILQCPHCMGYLTNAGDNSITWQMNREVPTVASCADCEIISKVPSRVPGTDIAKVPRRK